MPRELALYDDEIADPEASYRRGFSMAQPPCCNWSRASIEPQVAQRLSQWIGADLRDWRILGHEVADSPTPPPAPHRF